MGPCTYYISVRNKFALELQGAKHYPKHFRRGVGKASLSKCLASCASTKRFFSVMLTDLIYRRLFQKLKRFG